MSSDKIPISAAVPLPIVVRVPTALAHSHYIPPYLLLIGDIEV